MARKSMAASAYDCIRCVLFQRGIRIGYSALEAFHYSSGASPYSDAWTQSASLTFGNQRNGRDGQRNAFEKNVSSKRRLTELLLLDFVRIELSILSIENDTIYFHEIEPMFVRSLVAKAKAHRR